VYNGIKLDKFSQVAQEPFEKLKIINVARMEHEIKGQDILIKALKICKDKGLVFDCKLVGENESLYTRASDKYIKELIKNFGLEQEIKILGTRHDIPSLLRQSNLFILPSRQEGFGLVVIEAMAARVLTISSNIDGPSELIEHGKTGFLFETENPEDLAQKIVYVHKNMHNLTKIRQNASEFVKNFDIKFMSKNILKIYENLTEI